MGTCPRCHHQIEGEVCLHGEPCHGDPVADFLHAIAVGEVRGTHVARGGGRQRHTHYAASERALCGLSAGRSPELAENIADVDCRRCLAIYRTR